MPFIGSYKIYGGDAAQWTAADIIVNSGATLALNVGGDGEFTFGDIRKTGAGTLKLNGSGSQFRGVTTVRNGRLVVGGNVSSGVAGPLGLATTAVQVADSVTAATNAAALVLDGSYTFGRGVYVYPYTNGASVTVGLIATNSAVFSGAFMLSNTVQFAVQQTDGEVVLLPQGTALLLQ